MERTAADYEAQINNLSEMCASNARYLKAEREISAELLEALEAAQKTIHENCCIHHGSMAQHHHPDCDASNAAISKARGDKT